MEEKDESKFYFALGCLQISLLTGWWCDLEFKKRVILSFVCALWLKKPPDLLYKST
jgi:hypothetical protein